MEQRQIRESFTNLRSIYQDRERYNLDWAFKNAQEEMDQFQSKIQGGDLEKECALCDRSKEAMEKFQDLLAVSRSAGRKSKWYKRLFSHVYGFLTIAEVAVSFTFVFFMSQLSHMGGMMIHSEGFSLLFAVTFSFLKVVMERYWVEPNMERWGWKVYIDSVDRLDQLAMELMQVTIDEEIQAEPIPLALMGGMRNSVLRQISQMRESGMLAAGRME